MKRITIFFLTIFYIHSIYTFDNLGQQCAKHFNILKADLRPGMLSTIAQQVLDPKPEKDLIENLNGAQDPQMKKVFIARFEAVRKFYSFVKRKKVGSGRAIMTLSELAYGFSEKYPQNARYLLEDDTVFAKAAVELAVSSLQK